MFGGRRPPGWRGPEKRPGEDPEFICSESSGNSPHQVLETMAAEASVGGCESRLRIATGYMSPDGWHASGLEDAFDVWGVGRVRLLVGVLPSPESEGGVLSPLSDHAGVNSRFASWLREYSARTDDAGPVLQVRSAADGGGLMHAKTAVSMRVSADGTAVPAALLAGSANLTAGGMWHNREAGLLTRSRSAADAATVWFAQEWAKGHDCVDELASLYESCSVLCDPRLVFLKALWQKYHAELEAEARIDLRGQDVSLRGFQEAGVRRARRIIDQTGGVLIADEVGLGKTYMSGALIQDAVQRGEQVLVVCPKGLRSMWTGFLWDHGLVQKTDVETMSRLAAKFDDPEALLSNGKRFCDWADLYGLVVIDEAHHYRNPGTNRFKSLRRLMSQCSPQRRPDVALLTATPVSNSVVDLYWLLQVYARRSPELEAATKGEPMYHLFSRLSEEASAAHTAAVGASAASRMNELLDRMVVRRTRSFVADKYSDDDLSDLSGFPAARLCTISYELGPAAQQLFEDICDHLAPDGQLKLAVYSPENYLEAGSEGSGSPTALMRSMLLKRYESSPAAFRSTLERMSAKCAAALEEAGSSGPIASAGRDAYAEDAEDADELTDESGTASALVSMPDAARRRFAADVARDRLILEDWRRRSFDELGDPCLEALVEDLREISAAAAQQGSDGYMNSCRRKVLVFTSFRDTAEYLYSHLVMRSEAAALSDPLGKYEGRIRKVDRSMGSSEVRDALSAFAPVSLGEAVRDAGSCDLLVCTDAFSEGMNLQQACHVVNYDLPWNPMRLVQRHGRIDRLGSPHDEVFFRSVFPDKGLDRRLALEDRLRRKIDEAASAVGAPLILNGYRNADVSFDDADRVARGLLREDIDAVRGVLEPASDSADDLRARLSEEMRESLADRLRSVLPGAGAVVRSADGPPRAVFCAVVSVDGREETELRTVDLATAAVSSSDAEQCLRDMDAAAAFPWDDRLAGDVRDRARSAWETARLDIVSSYSSSVPAMAVGPKQRKAAKMFASRARAEGAARSVSEQFATLSTTRMDAVTVSEAIGCVMDPRESLQAVCSLVSRSGFSQNSVSDVRLLCWTVMLPDSPGTASPPDAAPVRHPVPSLPSLGPVPPQYVEKGP